MPLGPGCMTAGIPAAHCTRRHLLQAKQLGRVGERQDKELGAERETGERRGEERRGRGEDRGKGGLVVCMSCHKTWEMQLRLIRVNETLQNERSRSMGKVKV